MGVRGQPDGKTITHRGVVIDGAGAVKARLDTHWTPQHRVRGGRRGGTGRRRGRRCGLRARAREVPRAERAAVRDAYRRVHVDAFSAGFADFRVYRLEPTAVRYVGGFGRMSWVSTAAT